MFDYAQKNDDEEYNWGYNPYHYNVPEGRYVTTDYEDGTQAVKEMQYNCNFTLVVENLLLNILEVKYLCK